MRMRDAILAVLAIDINPNGSDTFRLKRPLSATEGDTMITNMAFFESGGTANNSPVQWVSQSNLSADDKVLVLKG